MLCYVMLCYIIFYYIISYYQAIHGNGLQGQFGLWGVRVCVAGQRMGGARSWLAGWLAGVGWLEGQGKAGLLAGSALCPTPCSTCSLYFSLCAPLLSLLRSPDSGLLPRALLLLRPASLPTLDFSLLIPGALTLCPLCCLSPCHSLLHHSPASLSLSLSRFL